MLSLDGRYSMKRRTAHLVNPVANNLYRGSATGKHSSSGAMTWETNTTMASQVPKIVQLKLSIDIKPKFRYESIRVESLLLQSSRCRPSRPASCPNGPGPYDPAPPRSESPSCQAGALRAALPVWTSVKSCTRWEGKGCCARG